MSLLEAVKLLAAKGDRLLTKSGPSIKRRTREIGRRLFARSESTRIGSKDPLHSAIGAVGLGLFSLLLAPLVVNEVRAQENGQAFVALEVPEMKVNTEGKATTIITLHASDRKPVGKLNLSISDFEHKPAIGNDSYRLFTESEITPLRPEDKAVIQGEAEWKGGDLRFKVNVTDLWEAGLSTASLQNDGRAVLTTAGTPCVLQALRIPAGYNVQLVPLNAGLEEVVLTGSPPQGIVRMKNADPMNYDFYWKIRTGDELIEGKNPIRLKANSESEIQLSLPNSPECASWLTSGTLKSAVVSGDLVLTPAIDGPAVEKIIPTTFRFNRHPETLQQVLNGFLLFVVLLAGGTFSIWTRFGIPNTIRVTTVKQRLRECALKIRGMSREVESQYRRTLASMRKAVHDDLHSAFRIFPSSSERIGQLEAQANMLADWVSIAYDIAGLRHQAEESKVLAPPTLVKWTKKRCRDALFPIQSGFTTAEELAAMKTDALAARAYLEAFANGSPIQELEKAIKEREERLKARTRELLTDYSEPFFGLIQTFEALVGTPFLPADYFARDSLSIRISLLNEFRALEGLARPSPARIAAMAQGMSSPAMGAASPPAAASLVVSHDSYKTLINKRERLFAYLHAETHESIDLACRLLTEMRQDIYVDRLLAEITGSGPPRLTIDSDPDPVSVSQTVRFALRFEDSLLNEAAARQELLCQWDLGDGAPPELGWEVYQVYERVGSYTVSVTIRDSDGRSLTKEPITKPISVREGDGVQTALQALPIKDQGSQNHQLEPIQHIVKRNRLLRFREWIRLEPLTTIEFVRLLVILAIAIFGLMATARAQIEKLSFFGAIGAAFAVGFAADMVKGAVTSNSGASVEANTPKAGGGVR